MKLRTKFAIGLLVITIVLSGVVYGGLELYKDRLIGQARSEVNETAVLTARQIGSIIEQRKDFIGFVASQPEASRFDHSDEFLDELIDNSRFFAAQLIARNGTIVDFEGDVTGDIRQESIGTNIANRTYFRRARTGEVAMSRPEYVNATDQYLVIISAPIFEDRRIKGVLAAAIYVTPQTFFPMLTPLETAGQRVVVVADGEVLHASQADFGSAIVSSATVDAVGWTVTVIRDRSPLTRQLRDLAILQGVGLFVVLLSVVGFGVWEYRNTLEQTRRLLDGFAALEAGDFDHTLSLSAGEEWEQISDGFNELAAEIQEREEAIRQREQRLEVLNRVLRHNLRNSAAVIQGYAEIIDDRATDDRIGDAARTIRRTADDLTNLSSKARRIEDTIASATRGRAVIDLVPTVEHVLETIRTEHPDVDVETSLPESARVYAIPSIELALRNVFENACIHNDNDEPRLEVVVSSVETAGESLVRIRAIDNGPGIPEQERLAIEEGEETPLEHGSGLGLWLVQWVVDRSEGTLRFEEHDPRGTVFVIDLESASDEVSSLDGDADPAYVD